MSLKKLLSMILLLAASGAQACTSAIISGKATADGRPLMWKHRDTDRQWNHLAHSQGEKFAFTGLVNSDDPSGDIWTGINEAGFGIMNTASYNLKDDTLQPMDGEGRLMRLALGQCKDLNDFEHFLDTLTRPMRVEANFGVIDAYGGAAYYETNNHRYYKRDVNDEKLAPHGYLIYTNFSFNGRKDEGLGYVRYRTAEILFGNFRKQDFTPAHILAECSRSFLNSQLGYDLKDEAFSPSRAANWAVEQDYIPRRESSAAIVIQGVRPGTASDGILMWTVLGYPPASPAIPVWVKTGSRLPALLAASEKSGHAPLCEKAVQFKKIIFPIQRGNGQKYIAWNVLYHPKDNSGILQQIQSVEDEIFALTASYQSRWKQQSPDSEDIEKLYEQITDLVRDSYIQKFGISFDTLPALSGPQSVNH